MKNVITDPAKIEEAVSHIKSQVIKLAVKNKKTEKHFPGGLSTSGFEYKVPCSLGFLYVMLPDKYWNERIPLLFTLNPKSSNFTSDVEINMPLGLDRSVGGCFIEDGNDILICNRGRFTSFKSSIPINTSLTFFKDKVISVNDGGKDAEVIYIANLKSTECIDQIAAFVKKLKALKFRTKLDDQNNSLPY